MSIIITSPDLITTISEEKRSTPSPEDICANRIWKSVRLFFSNFNQKESIDPFILAKTGSPIASIKKMTPDDYSLQDSDNNNTPLHWAIANANNEIAKEMIKLGPLKKSTGVFWLDTQCSRGNTPLHLAVGKGYIDFSRDGEPLTISNYELTQEMLKRGANPNIRNFKGDSPLHLACARRDVSMISLLLSHGADANMKNNDGMVPADLINLPFPIAEERIKKTVIVYLLPEREFEQNINACKNLFEQTILTR